MACCRSAYAVTPQLPRPLCSRYRPVAQRLRHRAAASAQACSSGRRGSVNSVNSVNSANSGSPEAGLREKGVLLEWGWRFGRVLDHDILGRAARLFL
jgi:hypothetical protein